MTKHEADIVRKFARHLDECGFKGVNFCTMAEGWMRTQVDEPKPAGDMTPLEMATMEELINEITNRSTNAIIYLEREGKENDCHLRFSGDPLRLNGIVSLRIIPEMVQWYAGMMRAAEGGQRE